jgi:hypothetical protein
MAQWGRNDQSVTVTTSTTKETSNGAPIGTYVLVKAGGGTNAHQGNTNGTRANADLNMFGNTTQDAFITGKAVGVFGIDAYDVASEMSYVGGTIAEKYITFAGSGYASAPTVTTTFANGTTNATAITSTISAGRVTALTIAQAGANILGVNPTISIAAPALVIFNGNSAVSGDTITLTSANSKFLVGDYITYAGNATSTPAPLVDGSKYYVVLANTTAIKISNTAGGTPITLTDASGDNTTAGGATFRGQTGTGYLVLSGATNKGVTHAGWVLRTEGSGGRAGRVQYETLVAMGSLGAQTAAYGTPATTRDASDDTILPE